MTLEAVMQQARALSAGDRRRLIKLLLDSLEDDPIAETGRLHDVMEFAGIGAALWSGIDAQQYVADLRAEWDDNE
jgi:hypothetical protein